MIKKMGNNTKKAVFWAAVLVLAAGAAGCASGSDNNDVKERRAIIDDYAAVILRQDGDSADFDEALSAVDAYVENPTAQQKEAAMTALEETIRQMEADSEACAAPFEASQELAQMLERQGISLVEYQMNADTRYSSLQGFAQDLTFLQEFLEYADEGGAFMEDLEQTYAFMVREQELMRGYNYVGINYWFAGWGEEETAYVREQVLDKLQSFTAQDAQWRDSRDAVEADMSAYLDEVEAVYDEWTAYVGASWEELKELEESAASMDLGN